jgi:hypothetical protein
MKCALYIGTHDKDDWLARVGWYITRHTQKGAYGHVKHCEAIHAEHTDGSVTIASASDIWAQSICSGVYVCRAGHHR